MTEHQLTEFDKIRDALHGAVQRTYIEDDYMSFVAWLQSMVKTFGVVTHDDAWMLWRESFEIHRDLIAARIAEWGIPADEKQVFQWPWDSWNRLLDPLEPGLLAVMSAGDGLGKTIYAEQIAEHWARRQKRVVFVHFELNRSIMLDRRMCRNASLDMRTLKYGPWKSDEQERIDEAERDMMVWKGNIDYLHSPGMSMDEVISELRVKRADGECDVVIIDYLEKAAPSQRQLKFRHDHYQREADNVEQIKNFAEANSTPVLMLAQMSKAGKLSHADTLDRTAIRGAGEKTEKANVVILLHRARNAETGYSETVDVRIDKNTVGRLGTFRQQMRPQHFRVDDVAKQVTLDDIKGDLAMSQEGMDYNGSNE